MAFSAEFDRKMVTFDGLDIIVDEKGARFLSIRKVQWVKNGDEPDKEKAKLELRKYTIDKDGTEIPGKGVSFLTDEGPHNLVHEMVKNGYGETKEVLLALKDREDFKDSVEHLFDNDEKNTGEYFDMRKVLTMIAEEAEDDSDSIAS